jgi:site-specific DNA-cytosine methylase
MNDVREIRHFHLFCGSGGGGKRFNSAQPRVGNMIGKFRCLGGIDVDPSAIQDFKLLTGVDETLIDVFDRDQTSTFMT